MKLPLILAPLLALLTGCGGSSSQPQGAIALLVTDAPVPFEIVQSATVAIDRITIDGGPFALAPARVLYEGAPISIELTALRNGAVRYLFSRNLPLFVYRRVHVHFSGAELELTNGHQFTTADGSLQLPQSNAPGFEVTIETPVMVVNARSARLMLDIDLPRSFLPQGTSNMLQAQRVRFEPLFHAVRQGATGEIRGLVTDLDAQGNLVPVGSATLYFLPAGSTDLNMAAATTGTDADGSFVKLGLHPGSYDVLAQKGGAVATSKACLVHAGAYSLVEIQLQ